MLDTVFCGSLVRDIEIKTFKESTYHQQSANVLQFEKHSGGEKHTTAWVSKSSSPTPPLLLCKVQQMMLVIDYASIPRYAATLRRLKKVLTSWTRNQLLSMYGLSFTIKLNSQAF